MLLPSEDTIDLNSLNDFLQRRRPSVAAAILKDHSLKCGTRI